MTYNRQLYIEALNSQLEPNIVKHCLALEACMGGIYDYLASQNQLGSHEPPKDDWLLAGLTHDIDFGGEFKESHPAKTKEAFAKYNLEVSDRVMRIIKAHAPDLTQVQPVSKAEWAIFCADSLTGLIIAVALILPSKKISDVKLSSVIKRFLKQPRFAAGTRREEIALCSKPEGLNIPLEKFIEICLTSMQKIAPELGL
ncbi:MAG: phosphohydrolase [Patescibacteria group bacterium]